jgi:hypothetical protein
MRIILGLIMLGAGIFMVIKSESMLRSFGSIEFFDRHLGMEGGSRLGYKLIGMMVIFIGMLVITNMIGDFMGWILSPLMMAGQPR